MIASLGHLRRPQLGRRLDGRVGDREQDRVEVHLGELGADRARPRCRTRRRSTSARTRNGVLGVVEDVGDPALAGLEAAADDEGVRVEGQRPRWSRCPGWRRTCADDTLPRPRAGTRSAAAYAAALLAPAVTRCSAPCWRPSYRARRRSRACRSRRRGLSRPQVGDPREAQREPGLVAGRAHDHVEGDLDDDRRLDHPVAPERRDRVGLEPAGHLGDLGVGQAAVGLADRDQRAVARRRGPRTCSRDRTPWRLPWPTSTPTTTQSSVASAFFIFSQPRPRRPGE